MLKTRTFLVLAACLVPVIAASVALAQRGGGVGGFGGRSPMVTGTVTQLNPSFGAIEVQPEFGQQTKQWVGLATDVSVLKRVEAKVADLQVGDRVMVSGWPTTIKVDELTQANASELMPSPRPAGAQAPNPPAAPQEPQAPTVTGRIISLDPLKIGIEGPPSYASDASTPLFRLTPVIAEISLGLDANSKVMQVVKATVNDIQVGDEVVASGQRDEAGLLTASRVLVNMGMGMRGAMGMGGMGGGMGRRAAGQ
jgi:hypothetical protein